MIILSLLLGLFSNLHCVLIYWLFFQVYIPVLSLSYCDLIFIWLGFLREVLMIDNNYKLHKLLLCYSEGIRCYQHHIAFISVYLNFNEVQKGFKINFYNNIHYGNYSQILKTCSLILMACTIGIYKKILSHPKINFQNVISTLQETFPDKINSAL